MENWAFVPHQWSWGGYRNGFVHPFVRPSHFLVSAHFWTNRSRNWYQTWWMHSLRYSPDLINFWLLSSEFPLFSGLWLVEQFQCICQQNADPILWANSLWASPGLMNFWSCSTEFLPFPGLWLVGQFPGIWRQTAEQIGLKFHVPTYYEPPQAWLTFGHAPWNFYRFLASDRSSSFRGFADKLLIRLCPNWVGQLIMDLLKLD